MTKHNSEEDNSFFLIAEVRSVFDSAGFVSLKSYSDFNERFFELEKVFVEVFGGLRKFIVEDVEISKSVINLKFLNFDTDEDVDFLVGKKIYVNSSDLVSLEDKQDTYFVHDLIGCAVYRNDKLVGKVEDVLSFPANDVYVIKDSNDKEILVPAIKDFISSVNTGEKVIILAPGEFDIYDDED